MTETKNSWSRGRILKTSLLAGLGIATAALIISLSGIFIPVGIALLIAYILNPVITFMDKHHSRRVFTVSLVYVLFVVLMLGSGLFLGPALFDQGRDLVIFVKDKSEEYGFSDQFLGEKDTSEKTGKKKEWWERLFSSNPEDRAAGDSGTEKTQSGSSGSFSSEMPSGPNTKGNAPETVNQIFDRYGSLLKDKLPLLAVGSVKTIFNGAGTVASFLMQLLLTFFYAFFFMLHFPKIRNTISGWIPHSQDKDVREFFREIDGVVAGFFRGRLLVCLVSAFVMSIGLYISGIPYWLLLGIAAGFLGIIPFIGVVVTLIPSLVIAVTSEHMLFSLIGVLITFAVVQGIVEPFVGPFVISQKVSLHPVTIVIVLLVGAALFGVLGLFVAIPLFGILKLAGQRYLAPTLRCVIKEE